MKYPGAVGLLVVACTAVSSPAWAGQAGSGAAAPRDSAAITPPLPVPPATVSRSGDAVTVRAVRLTTPLTFDGLLDDEIYKTVPAISDFIPLFPPLEPCRRIRVRPTGRSSSS